MEKRKGFTLIELMVALLIVAILAAVAIPILKGRIDAAKWSEGKSGAGTISVALRAFGPYSTAYTTPNEIGFSDSDLDGTYFTDESYTFIITGDTTWTITVNPLAGSPKPKAPTIPATMSLTVTGGEGIWVSN